MPAEHIELRGVSVNNLKDVDLDIPRQEFVVFCGVSGSGKTSLALDTLYAEGQRRYIEGFSAYTRQFLARLPKPAAERIGGIPPAIAVTHKFGATSSRATVGTATEVMDYLRLLYARIGSVHCPRCDRQLRRDSADSISADLGRLAEGIRFMVTFPFRIDAARDLAEALANLRADGFVRWIGNQRIWTADDLLDPAAMVATNGAGLTLDVIVDRLATGPSDGSRLRESLETALEKGGGRCHVYLPPEAGAEVAGNGKPPVVAVSTGSQDFARFGFSSRLACEDCQLPYPRLEPRLFSFNSPLGACPTCEGFGNVIDIDMDLVVPNQNKSLADGAIAVWNTPAYKHELEKLLHVADRCGIPTSEPYSALSPDQRQQIFKGMPEHDFGGIEGFFRWLERRKYKMHIRVFLSRWRSYRRCDACQGTRLRPESLCTRLAGKNLAELCGLSIGELSALVASLNTGCATPAARLLLDQVGSRIAYLNDLGLDYLSLDRPLRTLSGGEAQRVALTSALGSSLVNMLYVLGRTLGRPASAATFTGWSMPSGICANRGNTVVVVDHEESVIQSADQVFEIGPAPARTGGGSSSSDRRTRCTRPWECSRATTSSGRRGRRASPSRRRPPNHGWIRLTGATRQQPEERYGRVSLGGVMCRDRRQRIGQEHVGRGHALPGPMSAKAQRGPQAATVTTTSFGDGQTRRRDDGRPEPHRALAPVQSRDVHQGLRRDPRRVRRDDRSPHAQLHGQPLSASTSTADAAPPATATATSDRHAVPGRRLHAVRRVPGATLSARRSWTSPTAAGTSPTCWK